MKHKIIYIVPLLLPCVSMGQSDVADGLGEWADSLRGLQSNIAEIGGKMMGEFYGVLSSITTILALGLIFFIFTRVYRSLLAAEPIDWWSLLKPGKILVLVLCYPLIVTLIGTVLSPIRNVTAGMNLDSHERMVEARRVALENSEDWVMFIGSDGNGDFEEYVKRYGSESKVFGDVIDNINFGAQSTWLSMKYAFKAIVSEILRLFYESAILILHFISTFYLVILVTFGPIPLALTMFPGFENGFNSWIGQYIDKFLWLPIANILASFLNLLQIDMIEASAKADSLGEGSFFSATDFGYFIFMLIGIAAFMAVPSISSMLVSAGSPSTSLGNAAKGALAGGVAGAAAGAGAGAAVGRSAVGGGKRAVRAGQNLVNKIRGNKTPSGGGNLLEKW